MIDPYTKKARFDVERFKKDSILAMRAMDNIIDLEVEKIESILAKIDSDPESDFTKDIEVNLWKQVLKFTKRGRRAGISLIGHGDFFAMMGLKYACDEAINLVDFIHRIHAETLYETSIDLAKERESFECFDYELEKDNPFLERLFKDRPDLLLKMKKYGRRNIALLTIPPSGSLSILLQQSSGIEPAFMLVYKRRRKINPGEDVKVDFIDEVGDSWQEYNVFHPKFKTWWHSYQVDKINEKCDGKASTMQMQFAYENMDEYTSNDRLAEIAKLSPYAGCTANEIDPLTKVRMQGRIQRWVDHSISVTHNLPEKASQKTVEELYIESWKAGCKGCTIYRDGSRSGVLISSEDKKSESTFEYKDAPKRPRILPCDIYFPRINGKVYTVLVGLFEDKPYEVFAFEYETLIDKKLTSGFLKKQKSGVYHLLDSDKNIVVENIRLKFKIPEWDFATRMISTALRHGAAIDFVVEQLKKSPGLVVTDFILVIARQLKKYLNPTDESLKCPKCGEKMIVTGGCVQCHNCGEGKCS